MTLKTRQILLERRQALEAVTRRLIETEVMEINELTQIIESNLQGPRVVPGTSSSSRKIVVPTVAPSPQLSLLCIGFGLAEILQELKDVHAGRDQIDVLNQAFDQLGRAMGDWLVADAHDADHILRQRADIATAHMVEVLQEVAVRHGQLAARSAELQEIVQRWQSGVITPQA